METCSETLTSFFSFPSVLRTLSGLTLYQQTLANVFLITGSSRPFQAQSHRIQREFSTLFFIALILMFTFYVWQVMLVFHLR